MDHQRLKIKIGDNELDTEGPPEVVQARFEAFKELVLSVASRDNVPGATPKHDKGQRDRNDSGQPEDIDAQLASIMRLDDRIVSLTAPPKDVNDAILLVLLGQSVMRANESVTGAEVMDGLKVSGQGLERVDRLLQKAADAGDIIVIGQKRAKRYRLTNTGRSKARGIAKTQLGVIG